MSEVEFHTGRLRKIAIHSTTEEWCQSACQLNGIKEMSSYNKTWVDEFKDNDVLGKKYFIHNESIYEVLEHLQSDEENYFMRLINNADGTITFIGQFYNGGTCFDEMLEEALDEHNN